MPQMIAVLDDWNDRCVSVLTEIEGQVTEVRRKAAERRRWEKEHEKILEKAIMGDDRVLKETSRAGGKRGAGEAANGEGYGVDQGDAMDVDETLGRGGQRNAKRGGRFAGLGKRLGG